MQKQHLYSSFFPAPRTFIISKRSLMADALYMAAGGFSTTSERSKRGTSKETCLVSLEFMRPIFELSGEHCKRILSPRAHHRQP